MVATAEVIVSGSLEAAAYQWKFHRLPVAADVAAGEIRRLYEANGGVRAVDIVAAATPEDAPLHNCFEWDDTEAARLHRESQARFLLRSLIVVYRKADNTLTHPTRYAVNLTSSVEAHEEDEPTRHGSRVYIPVNVVVGEDELRRRYVHQALEEANQWRNRYRGIAELASVFEALDTVLVGLKEAG